MAGPGCDADLVCIVVVWLVACSAYLFRSRGAAARGVPRPSPRARPALHAQVPASRPRVSVVVLGTAASRMNDLEKHSTLPHPHGPRCTRYLCALASAAARRPARGGAAYDRTRRLGARVHSPAAPVCGIARDGCMETPRTHPPTGTHWRIHTRLRYTRIMLASRIAHAAPPYVGRTLARRPLASHLLSLPPRCCKCE